MSVRIICVDKPDGYLANPYEAISRFGWLNESTGESGYTDMAGMVSFLEKGNDAYTKDSAGDVAYLEVQTSARGNKYVRTIPDRTKADNLLRLGKCTG